MPTRPKTDARGHGRRLLLLVQRQGSPTSTAATCARRPAVGLQGQTLSFVSAEHADQCLKATTPAPSPSRAASPGGPRRATPTSARSASSPSTPHPHRAPGGTASTPPSSARAPASAPHPLVEFDRRAKDSSLWARTAGSWARTSWAACSCAAAASCSSSDSHKKN